MVSGIGEVGVPGLGTGCSLLPCTPTANANSGRWRVNTLTPSEPVWCTQTDCTSDFITSVIISVAASMSHYLARSILSIYSILSSVVTSCFAERTHVQHRVPKCDFLKANDESVISSFSAD